MGVRESGWAPRAAGPRSGGAAGSGVRATWWHTVGGLLVLQLLTLAYWWWWLGSVPGPHVVIAGPVLAALGAVAQVPAALLLMWDYPAARVAGHEDGPDRPRRARTAATFALGGVGAALLGVGAGSWMLPAGAVAFLLSLRAWPPGVRWRLVLVLTALLGALWFVDSARLALRGPGEGAVDGAASAALLLLLPAMSAFSLWWWDVVRELDRAREAEGALAATRERLRLAGEVHDLQGHHLQVIALQLELAERLIERDPVAAAEQVRTARASVDAARAGTRDLATRFRGVPLPDELANAADLLRAAGHEVEVALGPGVAGAPAGVLGPLVRESVTNVLKHGAVGRSRIALHGEPGEWVYVIANPRRSTSPPEATPRTRREPGTGLDAMRERIGALGGSVHVGEGADFELTVRVPVGAAAQEAGA